MPIQVLRSIALFTACFLFVILAAATTPVHAAIGAPVLKWAYGGCFASWCQTGWYASPAIADIDGDNQPDVVWGSYDVVALNGATGRLEWRAANNQRVWPGIVVADLDGNGHHEIVVGRGGNQLTVYDRFGATVWARNPFSGGEVRTLAVEDLEQNGTLEVIVGRASGGATEQVNVSEADGRVRNGWPARRAAESAIGYGWGMYNQNVTIADLNGDGTKEIIAPTDTHYITGLDRNGNQLPASPIFGAGKVWSQVGVHLDHQVDLRGYANCGSEHRPNFANSAPAIADVDGDGSLEIIVVGDVYNCAIGDPAGDLFQIPWILNDDRTRWSGSGYDWTILPLAAPGSGPLSQDYTVIQNAAINVVVADLDGDGEKEILYPSYDGRLHAYWLDKTQHGNWPFDIPGSGIRFAAEPIVVDLDGDGKAEVIVTSWPENGGGRIGRLHILDHLGNQLHAVDLPAPRSGSWNGGLAAPMIGNIDGDADLELVIGTVASGVVAYDLPGSAAARILWGTGRGSLKRSGVAAAEGMALVAERRTLALDPAAQRMIGLRLLGETGIGQVQLSVAVVPPGPIVSLGQNQLTPPANTTLTITAPTAAAAASLHTITITAESTTVSRSTTIEVLIGGSHTMLPRLGR
ncbi:MAG TPA: VCBS repeat-containing protein [Roseiflexaceae bacterium]|nr:VCBS repeat-containing protein [Roseiflexaceae bacterium]